MPRIGMSGRSWATRMINPSPPRATMTSGRAPPRSSSSFSTSHPRCSSHGITSAARVSASVLPCAAIRPIRAMRRPSLMSQSPRATPDSGRTAHGTASTQPASPRRPALCRGTLGAGTGDNEGVPGMHWIEESGLIAVIRLDDLSRAVELATALVEGGIRVLEFTYTNRQAGSAIEQVRTALGDVCRVGAGSVLDAETARAAMLAGAEFIVTPTLRAETIEICRRYSVPSVIGAFTATEILTAWEQGADYIKVN